MDTLDKDFAAIKAQCFRGVAKVDLKALNFEHPLARKYHRGPSKKKVTVLKKVFKRTSCDRLTEEHFIKAIVDDDALADALRVSSIDENTLRQKEDTTKIPYLPIAQVDCLDGLHRIRAAEQILDPNDQWWTVKLYSKQLSLNASTNIVEAFGNEQPFSDGEIFHKILYYRQRNDDESENRWWSRLTSTKEKDLRQLLKNKRFQDAFYALNDIPELFYPIQLGTLHRFLGLKCDEEILNYLERILIKWNQILGRETILPHKTILPRNTLNISYSAVDALTVQKLELCAPAISERDRISIKSWMQSKTIFPTITDSHKRDALLENILLIPCLIPTLRSCFENLKYLEPCCTILKQLLGSKQNGTIWRGFSAVYFRPENLNVEYLEDQITPLSPTTFEGDRWLGYVTLWAFCMRHFPEMIYVAPKKEQGKQKPVVKEPNPALWHKLGNLAVIQGFRTDRALELQKQDPDRELAIHFLKQAKPGCGDDISRPVSQVTQVLKSMKPSHGERQLPQFTSEAKLLSNRRCGRPFEDDHVKDQSSLFVPSIFFADCVQGTEITSFYVKRDLCHSFLKSSTQQFDFPETLTSFRGHIDANHVPRAPPAVSQRDSLAQKVERLENIERQLRAEIESLKGELQEERDSKGDTRRQYEQDLTTERDKNRQLQNKVRDLERLHQNAVQDAQREKAKLGEAEIKIQNQQSRIDELENSADIDDFMSHHSDEEFGAPNLQETISLLQGRIESMTKHEEALSAELAKQREGYIKRTAYLEAENSKLQVQLANQKTEKDELTSKLQKNKASVQTIQSRDTEVQVNLSTEWDRARDEQVTLLRNMQAQLEAKINQLRASFEAENGGLQAQLVAQKRENDELISKLQTRRAQMQDFGVQTIIQSPDGEVQASSPTAWDRAKDEQITQLTNRLAQLQTEVQQLRNQTVQLPNPDLEADEAKMLQYKIINLESELKKTQAQLKSRELMGSQQVQMINDLTHQKEELRAAAHQETLEAVGRALGTQAGRERTWRYCTVTKETNDNVVVRESGLLWRESATAQLADIREIRQMKSRGGEYISVFLIRLVYGFRCCRIDVPKDKECIAKFVQWCIECAGDMYTSRFGVLQLVTPETWTTNLEDLCLKNGGCYFGESADMGTFANSVTEMAKKRRLALARNTDEDAEEVVDESDRRPIARGKQRKLMFPDREIMPLPGQMEWESGPKNSVKDLDFRVRKALPTASTIAANESAIQESQTNINIDEKQNEALKERATAKTRKPRASPLPPPPPLPQGGFTYNTSGPSMELDDPNSNASTGGNQNEGRLQLPDTEDDDEL